MLHKTALVIDHGFEPDERFVKCEQRKRPRSERQLSQDQPYVFTLWMFVDCCLDTQFLPLNG